MSRHPLSTCTLVLLALFGAAVAAPGGRAAPPEPKVVKLPETGYDFALDPDTGTLAVVVPEEDKLLVCPKFATDLVTTGAKVVKVAKQPVAVIYKRLEKGAVFAVLSHDSESLTVIDAATLEVRKTVSLILNKPASLTCSDDPKDPAAYFFGGRGHDSKVARISLITYAQESVTLGGGGSAMDGVVSADGKRIYTRGPWSPSGFVAHDILRAEVKGQPAPTRLLKSEHTDSAGYLPDPLGQFVVSGDKVWTPDLGKSLSGLPFTPSFVSPARPLLLGVKDGKLAAASANSFKTIGSVKLPDPPPAPNEAKALAVQNNQADFKRLSYQTRILETPKGDGVLVCHGRAVTVVPYAALELPDEPFLAVRVGGDTSGLVGKKLSIPLLPRDPAVALTVADGPRGLDLEKNALTWTPTERNIGSHKVVVESSAKGVKKAIELTVVVRRPSVVVPFPVQQWHVSQDGAAAVVAGQDPPTPDGRPGEARLAVFDLKALTVQAESRPKEQLRTVAVDARHVYTASHAADAVSVLDRKDLSQVKRVFTDGRVREIVPVNDRWLFVATDSMKVQVFTLPELELAAPADVGAGGHLTAKGLSAAPAPPVRVGERWLFDGVLYDDALKVPSAVIAPRGLWASGENGTFPIVPGQQPWGGLHGQPGGAGPEPWVHSPNGLSSHPAWIAPWGVAVTHDGFTHGKRSVSGTQDQFANAGQVSVALPDQPALVTLRQSLTQTDGGRPQQLKAELVFRDLVAATPGHRITLFDEPVGSGFQQFGYGQLRLETRPGVIVGLTGERLFVLPTPKLEANDFPPPLRLEPKLGVQVLGEKDAVLPLPAVQGAKPPAEFSLSQPLRGLDVTAKGLKVERDTVVGWVTDQVATTLNNWRDQRNGQPVATATALNDYLRGAGPQFEKLVGRKPRGVPVWLPVGLIVRDKNLQSQQMTYGLFVELPEEAVRAKAKELRDEADARMRAANGGAQSEQLRRENAALLQKVTELEKRIDALTLKVETLTRQAEEKDKKK